MIYKNTKYLKYIYDKNIIPFYYLISSAISLENVQICCILYIMKE